MKYQEMPGAFSHLTSNSSPRLPCPTVTQWRTLSQEAFSQISKETGGKELDIKEIHKPSLGVP